MIKQSANLNPHLFEANIEISSPRDGMGEGLVQAGKNDSSVVALSADLSESVKFDKFKNLFPERYIEVGVAEQNLVTIASGMAAAGKIPFIGSYAVFSPGRNWEQIRTTVCYNNVPVKIIGSHAGITVGQDGATHQSLEDIALMRVLPNMVVISPVDSIEAQKAVLAVAANGKPSYIRIPRDNTPQITTDKTPFKIGVAEELFEGKDITVIACGQMVYKALNVANTLKKSNIGVRVINCHTVKPLDKKTILKAAEETQAIVTIEDHQLFGGLGSAISEIISQEYPVPIKMVGINDSFGESGEASELMEKYGLSEDLIIKSILYVLRMKNNN